MPGTEEREDAFAGVNVSDLNLETVEYNPVGNMPSASRVHTLAKPTFVPPAQTFKTLEGTIPVAGEIPRGGVKITGKLENVFVDEELYKEVVSGGDGTNVKMTPEELEQIINNAAGGDPEAQAILEDRIVQELGGPLEPNLKDSNPKDAVGIAKAYQSVVPMTVVWELGVAMLEGALRYGRHNYRKAGVRASVYYDATKRHLDDWWEGEDIDPDSKLSHITKAIASLTVLRDAMINDMWTDDRPPQPRNKGWLKNLNAAAKALLDKYPPETRKTPFTQLEHGSTGE